MFLQTARTDPYLNPFQYRHQQSKSPQAPLATRSGSLRLNLKHRSHHPCQTRSRCTDLLHVANVKLQAPDSAFL
ncbi:hypothetical protein BofuT4_uP132990.1 [Botrytis cinerea T4]|uniref:Uncharacterized protein n=1 Tax=Botryotinia fuckeliana (strain T4) TaxID=999810 RepID=G2YQ47_BOTF4|nr:hypothetical protein BofuT4_uP132990.1 [Botrytis cinerea T4]